MNKRTSARQELENTPEQMPSTSICGRELTHSQFLSMTGRFWSRVAKSESCWMWTGTVSTYGYGELSVGNKRQYAHRVSWELANAAIPNGVEVDHQCRVRLCVNPQRLRVVSHKQNMENRPLHKNNKSGYRGVSWSKAASKWKAAVNHNGVEHYLGLFESALKAARAASEKRNELFTNSPEDG